MNLPDFSKAKILVAGDMMLDRYWSGQASRISPESPVPVVRISNSDEKPGGAGNVAANISAMGGEGRLVGIIGKDEAGEALVRALDKQRVPHALVCSEQAKTVTKLRVISRHQQMIRLDFEETISEHLDEIFLGKVRENISDMKALIISDYGKGTIQSPQKLIELAQHYHIPVLVDPKGHDFERYRGATLLTPNRGEFERVMGVANNDQELVQKAEEALRRYELKAILVTRSEEGMTLVQLGSDPVHLAAQAKEVFDVTGAGDTVIAMIALSLAIGLNLEQAIFYANLAAGIAVTKLGAASVTPPELRAEINRLHGTSTGVVDEAQLITLLNDARSQGEKIIMTNGCFDILHIGHIQYLKKAKSLGDRLIVAVNSDESVRQLKGSNRPINGLEERMAILSELECIDWVVPFSELTPLRLIQMIRPDVLVKGGDYTPEEVVGREVLATYGGEVKIIEYVKGFSTSELINHIIEESA